MSAIISCFNEMMVLSRPFNTASVSVSLSSAMLTLHETNCCFYRSMYKLLFTNIKVTQRVTIKQEVCLVILVHIQDDLGLVCVIY